MKTSLVSVFVVCNSEVEFKSFKYHSNGTIDQFKGIQCCMYFSEKQKHC